MILNTFRPIAIPQSLYICNGITFTIDRYEQNEVEAHVDRSPALTQK